MTFLNGEILRQPINWAIALVMAGFGLALLSLVLPEDGGAATHPSPAAGAADLPDDL